jgi:hypothetical protein
VPGRYQLALSLTHPVNPSAPYVRTSKELALP